VTTLPSHPAAGYFRSGLPYNRFGRGPRPLVIFQGLMFENKPVDPLGARFMLSMYRFLERDYTAYIVTRKPGLSPGFGMKDMADDYAAMIREEFGGPLDVIGISTGGSIVQHFAAGYPDLVRRLVIHSSAHTLNASAREAQMDTARLASQGKWKEAYARLFTFFFPSMPSVQLWLATSVMALRPPQSPSDLVVTVEAEDCHAFKERLGEIAAPALVVAGAHDPGYSRALFRETAQGIPKARLALYEGMGHPASGKQFERDVLAFLREGYL